MDVDHDLIDTKHGFGDDFLEQLAKDYQWSSLLDGADASPSEILADATPLLVPPISPILSVKSSSSSLSDSGSDDDFKNSSSSASVRQSSQSPFDWVNGFDEPSYDLKLEDVELFLQKSVPAIDIQQDQINTNPLKKGPVVSIENGVIEGSKKNCGRSTLQPQTLKANSYIQNSYYKIENEHSLHPNIKEQSVKNPNIKHAEPQTVPNIIKKINNVTPPIKIPDSTNGRKIVLTPLPQTNGIFDCNRVSPPRSNIVINVAKSPGQNGLIQNAEIIDGVDISNCSDTEIIAIKKLQRTIKQRESACQSRQKTKEYVSTLEQQLIEAREIVISPLPQTNAVDCNRVSPPTSNIVINAVNTHVPTSPIQNGMTIPKAEIIDGMDVSNCSEAEIKAMKKQQRMIKNRESACQSRQKKKEYVSTLEQQLLEAQQEIVRLRLENKMLRDQLDSGGRGRKVPRIDTSLFIPKKNIAVLFAMVFMVSLNFNVLGWNSKPFVGPSMPRSNTRHLLWTEENAVSIENGSEEITNATYGSDCQNATYEVGINQTESIRIAGDLKRWIGGGKNVNWTYDVPRRKQVSLNEKKISNEILESYRLYNKLNLENLVEIPSSKNQRNIRDKSRLRRLRRKDIDFPENSVIDYTTLYRKPLRKPAEFIDDFGEWKALLQALHRRDDTFYVVGFGKGEHLLLPAVSHNITRPPKMALILPARSGNDSAMNDHVTLMQIDCSVVNTTIVQLKSDALPESLRKKTDDIKAHSNNPKNTRDYKPEGPSLPNIHKSSDNQSNYSNNSHPSQNIDAGEENVFASYLISKNSVRNKRNDELDKQKNNGTK